MQEAKTEKTFFGHPRQLSTIFHIELWERFSFYGMHAILLFYLYFEVTKGGLGIDKAEAGGMVGIYTGSVYLATLFGGWLADRVLGAERTLFYSAIVVMAGHIALAVLPSNSQNLTGLVVGLALIAIGSGGIKGPANAMVGALYEKPALRHMRDAGFSIFYLSINVAGFLGPLIVGYLQDRVGFHYAFGAAAVGMAIGLVLYSFGRKNLPHLPVLKPLQKKEKIISFAAIIAGLLVIVGALQAGWVNGKNIKDVLLGVMLTLSVIYFARLFIQGKAMGANRHYMIAYIPLFIVTSIFWMVWYQVYVAVGIYFESTVNRMIGTFEIPPGWLGTTQSIWVVLLASALAWCWMKMGDKQPKTPTKFAIAMVIVGIGFACFLPFLYNAIPMPLIGIVGVMFVWSVGELMLSPISLSFATKIAPEQFKTQMVGLNFLAIGMGTIAGGKVFSLFYDEKDLSILFELMMYTGFITGVVLFVLSPVLNRLLKGSE
ncbi:MAG: oligopeptide:H+ symporter [Acinetobacter sp.]|nr:oligopeptide:H+ symporter [Acinetobacter sp.]